LCLSVSFFVLSVHPSTHLPTAPRPLKVPGAYVAGDGSRRQGAADPTGAGANLYWITGRVDDVVNVSGHRLGTAEVEAALDAHPAVAETAVVGVSHPIKGQSIYAFVQLLHHTQAGGGASHAAASPELATDLVNWVRREIGPLAAPDAIHWAPTGLPKTRSGKIMRRVLRKIAEREEKDLGDTSTLADPAVVEALLGARDELDARRAAAAAARG